MAAYVARYVLVTVDMATLCIGCTELFMQGIRRSRTRFTGSNFVAYMNGFMQKYRYDRKIDA